MEGAAKSKGKMESNRLKNRFTLPKSYSVLRWADLKELGPITYPSTAKARKVLNRAVSFVGLVREVKPGGMRFGESVNCGSKLNYEVDAHIDVVLPPEAGSAPWTPNWDSAPVVVEVTRRGRLLARDGLLASNIATEVLENRDWSTKNLKRRLKGQWVRFSGYLFYDTDHTAGGWLEDPQDLKKREKNWRFSCWEVHPVMGIEVLPGRPGSIP